MRNYNTLGHGFSRVSDGRLGGFGEITATEDGQVAIPALINGVEGMDAAVHTGLVTPDFAINIATGLLHAAHAAQREQMRQAEARLVARGLDEVTIRRAITDVADLAKQAHVAGLRSMGDRLTNVADTVGSALPAQKGG